MTVPDAAVTRLELPIVVYRFCEGTPPVLQINDIRYDIFHLVMVYLYNGGSRPLHQVEAGDVLELMAAANFFQLPGKL